MNLSPLIFSRIRRMLFREIVFYTSTACIYLRKYLAGHAWYSRITPRLLIGALPLRSTWAAVEFTECITHIVSLLEPFEVKRFVFGPNEAAARGLQHLSLPVRDFTGIPTLEQIETGIRFINSCTRPEASVYVHCKAGRTRSAFLVACYLMHQERISASTAIHRIRAKRPHVRFSKSQLAALDQFAQLLSSR
ncbi:hypothetical protein AHF37_11143 [Paragonimus kellicotti]|nr:hypothetical protein AHF37_11143 [Paragonimus kellicotti]